MLAGELYDPLDKLLSEERVKTRLLIKKLNDSAEDQTDERNHILKDARPITIGEDVWVGGSAVICPGVSIGDRSVIGAGSVVTKDIPADVFAAGNPCRVIRSLKQEE